MMISGHLGVNFAGHLTVSGVDTVDIAKEYGTPLYVMDEQTIRTNLRSLKEAIDRSCENGGRVAFASKACSFKEMYRIVASEGCGTDVVSCGEMYTAKEAGMTLDRVYFHGNNKTDADLRYALENGVGRIVVDNFDELRALEAVAAELNKTAKILMRVTPGIDAHTHSFIRTGQIDSKFGFTLETGEVYEAVETALSLPHIDLKGLHCHVASQIFDEEPMIHAAEVMVGVMVEIRNRFGRALSELNLGGGFGIAYTDEDHPKPAHEYMELVGNAVTKTAKENDFPTPFVIVEPGRSIVAAAGLTLYTVGGVKRIPNVRTYVSVDGGMTDNPRYALYQAAYTAVLPEKAAAEPTETVTISGHCCESGDLLQENVPLPAVKRGDLLAFLTTGAYNYSMSSNYNRYPKPAVVMVNNGETRVVVRRETFEDVARNDI